MQAPEESAVADRPAAYAAGPTTPPLPAETVGANLARTRDRVGAEHEAVVDRAGHRRLTYGDLLAETGHCALGLDALGVARGDRVALLADGCAEWLVVQYGAARLGAILVPLNPAAPETELAAVLRHAGVGVLVTGAVGDSAAGGPTDGDSGPLAERLRAACPRLRRVITIGGPSWADLLTAGRAADPGRLAERERRLGPDDPVLIAYGRGPGRRLQGATLTHRGLVGNAHLTGAVCGYGPADRVCVPVPPWHCFGFAMGHLAATAHGATVVVPAPTVDPAATLAALREERCTSLSGVPSMFADVVARLDDGGAPPTTLRTGLVAGSPCPPAVMERLQRELGLRGLTVCHGRHECSPVCTQTDPGDDLATRTGTVGRVHPHLEIMIIDPRTGLPRSPGEPGELCVRGYAVMRGYWKDPERTAEVIDGAGWLHTGDLATLGVDGRVRLVGRLDDLVVRGGEPVAPEEVEEFVRSHPDVVDVRVVGVPDARFGEELVAWVRLRPGAAPLDAAGLRALANEGRVAARTVPRYVKIVTAFPTTAAGRVRRVQLRVLAVRELGLERVAGSAGD